jgi:ADP-ribose pyrophosphatase
MAHSDRRTLARGRFLQLVDDDGWEFVQRTQGTGVVMIVAVTDDDRIVLIEQLRPAMGGVVIEVPAGLIGDAAGGAGEDWRAAAGRELLEETGFQATRLERLAVGCTSPGLCDEVVTLCQAHGVKRVGPGGGDGSEQITVHAVLLSEAEAWLGQRQQDGSIIDLKVYAALAFARGECRGIRPA